MKFLEIHSSVGVSKLDPTSVWCISAAGLVLVAGMILASDVGQCLQPATLWMSLEAFPYLLALCTFASLAKLLSHPETERAWGHIQSHIWSAIAVFCICWFLWGKGFQKWGMAGEKKTRERQRYGIKGGDTVSKTETSIMVFSSYLLRVFSSQKQKQEMGRVKYIRENLFSYARDHLQLCLTFMFWMFFWTYLAKHLRLSQQHSTRTKVLLSFVSALCLARLLSEQTIIWPSGVQSLWSNKR